MDFKGQKISERLSQIIVFLFAIVALVLGYVAQDFGLMMKIFAGGVSIAFVFTVPDWPIYNKNPVAWKKAKSSKAAKPAKSWYNLF